MRFIIHELAYEKPLTAGKWVYMRDGQVTGAEESWRLTEAAAGYRFLRVDLDARSAPSGQSTLYHVTLDENGRAVQVKYRFWAKGLEIIGTVLLEEDAVIVTRETVADRDETILPVSRGYAFWFPATAGLGLLADSAGQAMSAVTLQTATHDPARLMGPTATHVTIAEAASSKMAVMGKTVSSRQLTISWQDQQRQLWVDEKGWPLRMERDDGLSAEISQQIVYQRITKPGVDGAKPVY